MGMGEPLANYENLLAALRILNAPWGGGIGARKITISTSGLAPQIRKLADEPLQFRLAISLHGATDETRNKIMPVNRKYPLAELTAACEYYQQKKGRMITLEYILIAGVNDGLDQVKPLAATGAAVARQGQFDSLQQSRGLAVGTSQRKLQEAFLAALEEQSVVATLRREKGHDIDAACGQLRLKTERELAEELRNIEHPTLNVENRMKRSKRRSPIQRSAFDVQRSMFLQKNSVFQELMPFRRRCLKFAFAELTLRA